MREPGDDLELTVDVNGTTVAIRPAGELDMHTSTRLLDTVRSHLNGTIERVELDGSQLVFVDSSGLRALVRAREAANDAGRTFVITEPSVALRKVLEITGLDIELNA